LKLIPVILALGSQREEDYEFETSLGYIVRSVLSAFFTFVLCVF
jgi:hypothetical protein